MKPKKVIFFFPYIDYGGVEKNFFKVANFFSKKELNVFLCTSSIKNKSLLEKNIKLLNPKINIKRNLNKKIFYLISILKLVNFLINNRDSIVFSFQANIYCILICKILGVKVIIRSNTSPIGWEHNFIKNKIYNFLIKLSNCVIVNSNDFKKQFDNKFGIKSTCILNPFDKKEIIKLSKVKNNLSFSYKKTFKIINIGRLTDQKDQITILKAFNLIKNKNNFELIIVGSGPEEKKLKKYLVEKKISKKNVRISNYNKNPYSLLKQSNIFVLSSKYEGLPNVLLEAISLKKFIISTKCPTGPNEIIKNNKNGIFFKIGNYKDLHKKILYLKNNPKLLKNKKMQSVSSNILKKYDPSINLMKYYQIINKLK